MQGDQDPQAAISQFIGAGGRASKDAFYKRLAETEDKNLPSQRLAVTIRTFEPRKGRALAASGCLEVAFGIGYDKVLVAGTTEEQWLVLNTLGGSQAKRIACQSKSNGRSYVPWTGVAAQIGIQRPGADRESVPPVAGQAFFFLPLPVRTGLPVHVNGTFELSSNRRDVWHGQSMSGDGLARAAWNVALLKVSLSPLSAVQILLGWRTRRSDF